MDLPNTFGAGTLLSLLVEGINVEDAAVVSVETAGDLSFSESDLESSALDERLDLL